MKLFIAAVLALLAFSATVAAAGNPSLCAKDGWLTAQSDSGASFASKKECTKAHTVFQPTLTITPAAVGADEQFRLTASGFHADATTTVYFAITGQAPFGSYVPFNRTAADGTFTIPFVFAECRKTDTGNEVPVDLTISLVDSFGVHASARMTLC